MPNGRNAGRLFADCFGEHGYGNSHAIGLPNGDPIPELVLEEVYQGRLLEVKCHSKCQGDFLMMGNDLIPVGAASRLDTHEMESPHSMESPQGVTSRKVTQGVPND